MTKLVNVIPDKIYSEPDCDPLTVSVDPASNGTVDILDTVSLLVVLTQSITVPVDVAIPNVAPAPLTPAT